MNYAKLLSIIAREQEPYRTELTIEMQTAQANGITPREWLKQFAQKNLTVIHKAEIN